MQEYLINLLDQSSWPFWSAFLLGLITSLGPCTLTTNITAISFISKEAAGSRRIFAGGIVYTLGRAFTYSGLALVLSCSTGILPVSGFFSRYGEKLIGPVLVFIGLAMLDFIPISFPSFNRMSHKIENYKKHTYLQDFLLGVVFALAFCSYSGVMYFGLLVPMTLTVESGLFLPFMFALGTGLPVLLLAWLAAFAFSEINRWFLKIKHVELWLRRAVALLFIGIGLYKVFLILAVV